MACAGTRVKDGDQGDGTHSQMLRGAKKNVDHGGKGGGVEAVDGREAGEKGVGEACVGQGGERGGGVVRIEGGR